MPKRDSELAELEQNTAQATGRPKLVVPLGRGNTGKTVFLRWLAERAQSAGRPLIIADADRTNQTLAAYFDQVISPVATGDLDMKDWLDALLEQQVQGQQTVLLDLGGGDLVLKRHAAELELVPFMARNGVDVAAVHMIGPNLDDLAYLQDVERDAIFAPEHTVLVLNEGLVPASRSEESAFEAVMEHDVFRAAVARGARIVRMPRLGCLHEIENRRLSFAAAEAGESKNALPPLGLVNRQRVAIWLRDMNEAFAPVGGWLA